MSAIIRCKLETLSEMCTHLGLATVGSGKGGRIIRDDYLKALRNSAALVRVRLEERKATNFCKANQSERNTQLLCSPHFRLPGARRSDR